MGLSLQLQPRPAGKRLVNSKVIIQQNSYGIRVLDREARSKNKQYFSKASSCSSSTNVLAPQLERQMEAANSIPTWDNVAHSRVNSMAVGQLKYPHLHKKELK